MTISDAAGRTSSEYGQPTAGFIIRMIRDAEVDEYLKAIFDSVKERKSQLEADGGLPGQKPVPQESIDTSKVQPDSSPPPPPINTANGGARHYRAKGGNRIYKAPERPDPNMQVFTGVAQPLRDMSGIDQSACFGYKGLLYSKKDLIGQCINAQFEGVTLRIKVIGIGPKAVKVLMVDEPPSHLQHNKKSLRDAWSDNKPVFVSHDALAPWLGRN